MFRGHKVRALYSGEQVRKLYKTLVSGGNRHLWSRKHRKLIKILISRDKKRAIFSWKQANFVIVGTASMWTETPFLQKSTANTFLCIIVYAHDVHYSNVCFVLQKRGTGNQSDVLNCVVQDNAG